MYNYEEFDIQANINFTSETDIYQFDSFYSFYGNLTLNTKPKFRAAPTSAASSGDCA